MLANPSWPGAIARLVENPPTFSWDLGTDLPHQAERGFEPMVICSRRFAWRWGPGTIPFQGLPCIVGALSAGVVIFIGSMGAMLQDGISFRDAHGYFDTPSGHTYAMKSCSVVVLQEGDVLWIPAGYLVSAIITGSGKEAVDPPELGFCWSVPLYNTDLVRDIPPAVRSAIAAYNLEHFQRSDPKKVWEPKAQILQKLAL